MTVRPGALLAVAWLLAGCGGGERAAGGTALDRAVAECGLPRGHDEAEDPAARLLPGGARLVASGRTGRAHRAIAVIAASPVAAVEAFVERARDHGYALQRTEDEGFEADALLARPGEQALVKVYAGSCADASRAIVTVAPAAH